MDFDDELKKFEELTKDFNLSPSAKRDAAKVKALKEVRPLQPTARPKLGPWQRVLAWAENRSVTQGRSWARS